MPGVSQQAPGAAAPESAERDPVGVGLLRKQERCDEESGQDEERVHAEESAAELYAALDVVVDKLARQLRKRKTRRTDKVRSKTQKAVRRRKTGA